MTIKQTHRHYWKDWCDGMASCRCHMTLEEYEALKYGRDKLGRIQYPKPMQKGRD